MSKSFSSIAEAVDSIGRGEVIVVIRELGATMEGSFICSAELVTAETVTQVMSGRGDFCVSVLAETAERLRLDPLVENSVVEIPTEFLTPLDHVSSRSGVTAEERAVCVCAIAGSSTGPDDFRRPGHVHIVMAEQGGVLRRSGHPEAAVDLAQMAGLAPVGVLCEILDDDGDRATRDRLLDIVDANGLCIISIDDLIAHRRSGSE